MKKILFSTFSKSRQRGVALLFALAILALLLVMALSFATSSIFDQITASNAANAGSTRLLAGSALNRVLTIFTAYGGSSVLPSTVYSYDPATNHKDMLGRLFAGSGINLTNQQVSWEYITQQDSTSNRLVGRFAYIASPVGGIDPGIIVRAGVDEALDSEPRVGAEVDEINVISVNPADITAHAAKFNYTVAAALPAAQLNPGFFDGNWIDYTNLFTLMTITDVNLQDKFKKWFVINSLISDEKYWVDVNGNKAQDAGEYFHRFNLARTDWATFITSANDMYEKILLDADHNGIPDFAPATPPAGMNFVTPGIANGFGIPWLAYFGYNDDGTLDLTAGATFGSTPAGVVARRRQIAANLVEYCKAPITGIAADSAISDSANWVAAAAPTYTGNKQTPYIDEVGVALEALATYTTDTTVVPNTLTVNVALNGYLLGKLVNIYSLAAWTTLPFTLKVKGTISYKVTVDGVNLPGTPVVSQPFDFDLPSPAAPTPTLFNWNLGYGTRIIMFNAATLPATLASPAFDLSIIPTPNPVTIVKDVSVYIEKAVLYDTSAGFIGYDYSTINQTSTLNADLINCDSTTWSAIPKIAFFSFQTEDPRQNLNSGDWYTTNPPVVRSGNMATGIAAGAWNIQWENPAGSGYSGTYNTNGNPLAAYTLDKVNDDAENVNDPAGGSMSTAFIRNAPMLSPWELGFIHRGVRWQTLNLKKYDKNKAATYLAANIPDATYPYARIPGGGRYYDTVSGCGDANILNQVKMTDATQKYKVNINAKYVDLFSHKNVVLQALLAKIVIGSAPLAPGSIGAGTKTAINPALDTLCNAIMSQNYNTRAEVANARVDALSSGVCGVVQDTDAKQEELIGKFINLTDVNGTGISDYYTVIILAQTIKDIGATGGLTIIKKDRNGNVVSFDGTVAANAAPKATLGTFDVKEFPAGSGNYVYVDEIVAEQKIRVIVHREGVGVYKILSFEYME